MQKFLRQELLIKTGHSEWDAPQVYFYVLPNEAPEEEQEGQMQAQPEPVAEVASDPEELQDWQVVTVGDDKWVAVVDQVPSSAGSIPVTPGWDIVILRP